MRLSLRRDRGVRRMGHWYTEVFEFMPHTRARCTRVPSPSPCVPHNKSPRACGENGKPSAARTCGGGAAARRSGGGGRVSHGRLAVTRLRRLRRPLRFIRPWYLCVRDVSTKTCTHMYFTRTLATGRPAALTHVTRVRRQSGAREPRVCCPCTRLTRVFLS